MSEDSYYDDDGKVICQVCGDSFKRLAPHVCRTHEFSSVDAYKDQFPSAPTIQLDDLSHGDKFDVDISSMTLSEVEEYFEQLDQKIEEYRRERESAAEELQDRFSEIEA